MGSTLDIWITAHRDRADEAFEGPTAARLLAIRDGLARHGYALKLDVGKTTTRATVTRPDLKVKTTYKTLDGFMEVEEARIRKLEAGAAERPANGPDAGDAAGREVA